MQPTSSSEMTLVEVWCEGVDALAKIYVDGYPYAAARRNAASASNSCRLRVSDTGGTLTITADYAECVFVSR